MIDFKTYDEQIGILEDRGMIFNNYAIAKDLLQRNNYYNLINGYKDIFVKKGITPEQYIDGVSFLEVYALHQFDKELRAELARFLIVIERTFASVLSYDFSKSYQNHDEDYLNINNYNTKTIFDKQTQNFILLSSEFVSELEKELIKALQKNDPMICHYKNKYNRVPLWVFVNKLTFGTLSKMYRLLKPKERDTIAKNIEGISGIKLYADNIQNALDVLVLLRNKCAHDQRIYDFNPVPTTIKPNEFLKKFFTSSNNIQSLFGAISCMSFFLKEQHFNEAIEKIKYLIKNLFANIHSIPTQAILTKMGIPQSFLSTLSED